MNKKFRVGALGAGRATQELTIPAFKHVYNGELLSVCDTNQELARTVAISNNLTSYTNLQEMTDKEKLDVIIINTPVSTHAPLAVQAMRAGCHVVIEKPAVDKLNELEEIRQVSQETGKKFTIVHNYKYYEGPQKAYKLYKEGVLGDILHVDRVWMSPPQNDRMEIDRQGWWHKMPGGRLADALPHMLYIPYMFVGKMKFLAVSAKKLSKDRPWSFCDESNVILHTPKAYVNIRESVNQESWPYKGYTYHTIIYGTKLNLFCDHHDVKILYNSKKKDVIDGIKSAISVIKDKIRKNKNVITRGAHNVFYEKFFDYINDMGPNPTTYEEAYNVAVLTDQIAQNMQKCVDNNKKVVCVEN